MSEGVWTIRKLLAWTTQFLQSKQIESPKLEAELLLAHVLNCSRIHLFTRYDEVPAEKVRESYRHLIKQRAQGVPVAYLTGSKEFYSLPLSVSPAVLIPRSDTGIVVDQALKVLAKCSTPQFADIGTGSGAIALAILKNNKQAQAVATDISSEALAIAQKNAATLGLSERINFRQGDLLAPLGSERFDLIVSNPPYIAQDEFVDLDAGVREHEPRLALDGGPDGLSFYRRLAAHAKDYLKPHAVLMVEIGHTQEPAVRMIFEQAGGTIVGSYLDLAKRPRVVAATFA